MTDQLKTMQNMQLLQQQQAMMADMQLAHQMQKWKQQSPSQYFPQVTPTPNTQKVTYQLTANIALPYFHGTDNENVHVWIFQVKNWLNCHEIPKEAQMGYAIGALHDIALLWCSNQNSTWNTFEEF